VVISQVRHRFVSGSRPDRLRVISSNQSGSSQICSHGLRMVALGGNQW